MGKGKREAGAEYLGTGDVQQTRRNPFGRFHNVGAGLCHGAAGLVILCGAQGLAGVAAVAGLFVFLCAGSGDGVAPH